MDNPPQITWESLLKQRFYDAINAQGTERETQVVDMAIKEMQKEIQELARLNRHEGIKEMRTQIVLSKPVVQNDQEANLREGLIKHADFLLTL